MKKNPNCFPLRIPGVLLILAMVILTTGCHQDNFRLTPLAEDVQLGRIYAMKQRFWTLGEQFIIRDSKGEPVFHIKGKVFSIGDKLSFQDLDGRELAYISEQVLSLLKRYRIYRPDGGFAVVKKKLTLIKDAYVIEVPDGPDYEVRGNLWEMEYSFFRTGRLVAVVSQKLLSWTDTYAIQVARGEDDILILAAAVVIDLVNRDKERERHEPQP
jgi:uncharacterized protein YxjI